MPPIPTTPQRILYVITKSNFLGAQRYVYDLAVASKAAGHEVIVACGGVGPLTEKLAAAGIETRTVDGFARDIKLTAEYTALRALYALFKELQPTVVHLNSSKAGVLGSITARLAGVPRIIFTAHGWPFFEPRNKLWKGIAWLGSFVTTLLSHQVICVSEHDRANTRFPFGTEKMVQIYNGIDAPQLLDRDTARNLIFGDTEAFRTKDHFHLVSIGELNHNKNHVAVLAALGRLHTMSEPPTIHYTIMGDGELDTDLYGYRKSYQLENEVTFTGYVENPTQYLLAFDALIMPSKKEGLPYVLLEAAHSGIPIIAGNVGGIPEVLAQTENSVLINPHDSNSIAYALTDMTMRKNSGRLHPPTPRTLPSFTKEQMVRETLATYDS